MLKKLSVIAMVGFLSLSVIAAEEHTESGEKKSASRPAATKKKGATLAEKISACLAERPSAKKEGDKATASTKPTTDVESQQSVSASTTPNPNSSSGVDGAALFTKHCGSCHSAGEMDWASAKDAVGVTMPKGRVSSVPAEEVAALREYFQSQIK